MNTEDSEFERIEAEAKMRVEQQAEPEFFSHNVEQPYDWSEWVCPDPKSYLMKCCDCGLVHEAEFGVVRYKSETEREDCDRVDDPNLQAVFRMRRSEQWSPEDTAHRAGGMPMAQPEQKLPPEWPLIKNILDEYGLQAISFVADWKAAQRTWEGLTPEEILDLFDKNNVYGSKWIEFARTVENKLKEKNT